MPLSRIRDAWRAQSQAVRELAILTAALLVGMVAMPLLIHAIGTETLGEYAHGGRGALLREFFRGLADGSLAFWAVALGPYVFLSLGRIAVAVARRQRATHPEV